MFHIFHSWTKWRLYEQRGLVQVSWDPGKPMPYVETHQIRTCTVCGLTQSQEVAAVGLSTTKEPSNAQVK